MIVRMNSDNTMEVLINVRYDEILRAEWACMLACLPIEYCLGEPHIFHCISPSSHSQDMYSGLVGPLIICRKGILEPCGRRSDMDREFALLFLIFDENESWYLEENVANYRPQEPGRINLQDETFLESNKMHGL